MNAFKAAVGKGQYEFPKGIIFGGKTQSWSNETLRHFVSSLPGKMHVGVVLDIHTGLGEEGQVESFTEESDNKLQLLKRWFQGTKLTVLGDVDSLGYPIMGSISHAFTEKNSDGPWYCVALEFGTQNLVRVLLALQANNWLHCFASDSTVLSGRVQQLMTDAFVVRSDRWKNEIINATLSAISKAIAGMAAFPQAEGVPHAAH